jgi:hypothetical protein
VEYRWIAHVGLAILYAALEIMLRERSPIVSAVVGLALAYSGALVVIASFSP